MALVQLLCQRGERSCSGADIETAMGPKTETERERCASGASTAAVSEGREKLQWR